MELPIFNTYINLSHHHFYCFIVAPLFLLDKSMAWNRYLQHPCLKNLCEIAQASKNADSNTQHFLSDLRTHSWFHYMLFAFPGYYQFPYTVMNRCFYLNVMPQQNKAHNLHTVAPELQAVCWRCLWPPSRRGQLARPRLLVNQSGGDIPCM
jgi:hypothetical protein